MSDIWFCCKKTDKVVELSDCLECKEPKNCLSLASYKQGRADEREKMISIVARCIAHNIYNVSEGVNLMNEIKEELEQLKEKSE